MFELTAAVDSVVGYCRQIMATGPSDEYNYCPGAYQVIRKVERVYGQGAVPHIISRCIGDGGSSPATRVFLGSLERLLISRQDVFENFLDANVPGWDGIVAGNPQQPLPQRFTDASNAALDAKLEPPAGLYEAIRLAISSPLPDVAVSGLRAATSFASPALADACLEKAASADKDALARVAIHAVGAHALLHKPSLDYIVAVATDDASVSARRVAAMEGAMGQHPAQVELRRRVFGDEAIWAQPEFLRLALDSGQSDLLARSLSMADVLVDGRELSILYRYARLAQVPGVTLSPRLGALAADVVRPAVTELASNSAGLVILRGSGSSALWIGHAGVLLSGSRVMDCQPSRQEAVKQITLAAFKGDRDCWGIFADNQPVDLGMAVRRAIEISTWDTEYDANHLNQKGEWIKRWFCRPKYWECDCVGFVEHCYEFAGGDPVPNNARWPITPRNQRDHMIRIRDC